ncbi:MULTISPECIES: dienelactone hydrolase family protein [unclassified Imperialibacter]|uniref:dienelactone hydrolase family protein n=1 Tax=unclassified Imperialibacter TaxID=2629706 RepID=UPI00125750C7|nr:MULTISPECIES: dienelactone hydrolase family protein [unclassified Imperialibacter]CAD5257238.1 Dienelactone hydrolase [Imperialibacter sp. 75]CAD5260112.1 Dienelactone hydrolase [Imperialibacter sp. 89]VVT25772.1 Dienelactone hydrolase [Imperialibacter sp. EC-SDR9]
MDEIKKEDIKQEVFDLYDYYVHNKIDRREFVEKISFYAVGGLTVPAMLNFLMPKYQQTLQVPVDDPRLKTETVGYDSPKGAGKMQGQLSRPVKAKGKLPGIVVVHENRGLNPHIADVGRRAALEGFISMSPDALFPLGGYPGNDDDGRELQRKRDRDEMLEDFIAAYDYLKGHPECNGKIGVVGFCFGGWISNMMAVKIPGLKASVPFYGGQPTAEETAQIKASMLIQYAGLDTRVNEGWPAYEAALKANKVDYQVYIYPDVNHGFHNDSTPRYDKEAAVLAWGRTVEFFKEKLG